jgi:hypothetical protein
LLAGSAGWLLPTCCMMRSETVDTSKLQSNEITKGSFYN